MLAGSGLLSADDRIEKLDDELLLFAGQQLHLLDAALQLRDRTWLGAHGVRLTTQELGHGDSQGCGRALNEIQRRVGSSPSVVVNHLPSDTEPFSQFTLRESLTAADGGKPLAEQGGFFGWRASYQNALIVWIGLGNIWASRQRSTAEIE